MIRSHHHHHHHQLHHPESSSYNMRKKQGTPAWKKVQEKKICIAQQQQQEEEEEEEEEGGGCDDCDLVSQFKNLQQYWDTIQSNPTTRSSSSDTKCPVIKSLHLFDNSPQKLMSSLQRRRAASASPSPAGVWKVRTNDLAVEEILRERRAAIESGKLKGRRLFWGPVEGGGDPTEMDLGYSDWSDLGQDRHHGRRGSVSSYGSSADGRGDIINGGRSNLCCGNCSGCSDDTERSRVMVEERNVGEKGANDDGDGASLRAVMVRVCIAFLVFILCLIFMKVGGHGLGHGGGGHQVFLVPT